MAEPNSERNARLWSWESWPLAPFIPSFSGHCSELWRDDEGEWSEARQAVKSAVHAIKPGAMSSTDRQILEAVRRADQPGSWGVTHIVHMRR